MDFEKKEFPKAESTDSLLSPDYEDGEVTLNLRGKSFLNMGEINKSLENILLDGPVGTDGETSRNESLINLRIFDDVTEINEVNKDLEDNEIHVNLASVHPFDNSSAIPASEMSQQAEIVFSMHSLGGVESYLPKASDSEEESILQQMNKPSYEEIVEVGFEQGRFSKSPSNLSQVSSDRSLLKFFANTSSGVGNDVEGKNFFDSFTTAQEDDGEYQDRLLPSDLEDGLLSSSTLADEHPSTVLDNANKFQKSPISPDPLEVEMPMGNVADIEKCEFALIQSEKTASCQARSYDAWIPSEKTKQSLLTVLANGPNVIVPFPMNELTMPGVVIEESLGDPIRELLLKHIGEQEANKRLVLTADSVPQDQVGLQQLIRADCLRAAVDLTSRLLTSCGQGPGKTNQLSKNSSYSLQLWFCRLSLLARLHLYAHAECEWQPFGDLDNPDMYYEFHQLQFPGRKGSMVPFEMRIIHAELPQYLGRCQESLDRLYSMLFIVSKIIKNLESGLSEDGSKLELTDTDRKESLILWRKRERRVFYCIANCLLSMKDYQNCLQILSCLLLKDPENEHEIYNSMGRIYLQFGDIESAECEFSKIKPSHYSSEKAYNIQKLINRGFIELGLTKYNEAFQTFKKVFELDKNNILAINNMCVCALYLEKLKESLKQLELLIYTAPKIYLQEVLVLNLSTLYELESSKANIKKQNLLRLVGQYRGTGFNMACLKMS